MNNKIYVGCEREAYRYVLFDCQYCGKAPAQLSTTLDDGKIETVFVCRTPTCEEYWKSPKLEMWRAHEDDATIAWNLANEL